MGSFPAGKRWSAPHTRQAGGTSMWPVELVGVSIVPGTVCPTASHFLRLCQHRRAHTSYSTGVSGHLPAAESQPPPLHTSSDPAAGTPAHLECW